MAAEISNMSVAFDGVLRTDVRGKLVVEFIKYMVYQQNLFPSPYDRLKKDVEIIQENETENKLRKKRSLVQKEKVLSSMETMFRTVSNVFIHAGQIKQVLIVIGSTLVTAKETYSLIFPTNFYEGSDMHIDQCKNILFKQLIMSCFIEPPNKISKSSKMMVFVLTSRHCIYCKEHLTPKPIFKMPRRGQQYEIELKCCSNVGSADLSHVGEMDFDISGIEPLETTVMDVASPLVERIVSKHQNSESPNLNPFNILRKRTSSLPSDKSNSDFDEFIWFQVPETVKGIKL